ncbi:MAG TPA: cytochrome c [Dongiaceae bacterium]
MRGQRFARRCIIPAIYLVVVGAVLFLGLLAGAGQADIASDRAVAMNRIRNSFRVLVTMAQAGTFDAAAVQSSAYEIVADLIIFKGMFPAGAQNSDRLSRPEIWTDRAGFDAAWEAGDSAASKLGTVSDADAYVPALQTLAAACRGCHKKYIMPQ